jgi:hypothetical protein
MKLYKQLLLNAYAQLSVINDAAEYLSLMETIEALQKRMDELGETSDVNGWTDKALEPVIAEVMSALSGEDQIAFCFDLCCARGE